MILVVFFFIDQDVREKNVVSICNEIKKTEGMITLAFQKGDKELSTMQQYVETIETFLQSIENDLMIVSTLGSTSNPIPQIIPQAELNELLSKLGYSA